MTTAVNTLTPVPQASLPSSGSKGKSVRLKGTRTVREFAKRLSYRWCSDAGVVITYPATFPVMWYLASPPYLDLVMKAGAIYKAKYWPSMRKVPMHRTVSALWPITSQSVIDLPCIAISIGPSNFLTRRPPFSLLPG